MTPNDEPDSTEIARRVKESKEWFAASLEKTVQAVGREDLPPFMDDIMISDLDRQIASLRESLAVLEEARNKAVARRREEKSE